MADEVKTPVVDEFVEYMKKFDEANIKLQEKLRKDTDGYQAKMEAFSGTTLASYPCFQPYASLSKVIAAYRSSEVDRTIINSYLDALVAAGTPAKADVIRAAVRAALNAGVGG